MYATGVGLVIKFLEERTSDETSIVQLGTKGNAGLGDFLRKCSIKLINI